MPEANGQMLRIARQRRGFQQNDAAKRLGVDSSLLSRMENKLVEIREDVVLRASKIYNFPKQFFEQTDPIYGPPVSVHPMWRRKADVTVRELDSVVAELNIRVMHLRRLLDGADVEHTNNLPKLDISEYGSAEKIASVVRAHWQLPSGPLHDLTLCVERAGIIVAHSDLSKASISGVTFAVPGMKPLIVLNSDMPADRMRFTLAHELGHLIMHRFPNANMEQEANEFATSLLTPASDVKPYLIGRKVDLALLASLKPEWRVSMASLLMTARKIGAINQNQSVYLWKQLSTRGMRLREPPELDFPIEKPTILANLINVHTGQLGYSEPELANLLVVYESELDDLKYLEKRHEKPGRPRFTIVK
jgi:Zn-dependent peptidase ImmA (M78 family)/transcriptional regulator with XRE-family HTH domain